MPVYTAKIERGEGEEPETITVYDCNSIDEVRRNLALDTRLRGKTILNISRIEHPSELSHIVVLTIDDDDCLAESSIHRSVADAIEALAEHCRSTWSDHLGPIPKDPHEICETYFQRDGDLKFSGHAATKIFDLNTMAEITHDAAPRHVIDGTSQDANST